MYTFMDAWRRRQRIERELRFLEQLVANRAAWRRRSEIEDLADPHGKRFLFEASSRSHQ